MILNQRIFNLSLFQTIFLCFEQSLFVPNNLSFFQTIFLCSEHCYFLQPIDKNSEIDIIREYVHAFSPEFQQTFNRTQNIAHQQKVNKVQLIALNEAKSLIKNHNFPMYFATDEGIVVVFYLLCCHFLEILFNVVLKLQDFSFLTLVPFPALRKLGMTFRRLFNLRFR